MPKDTITIETTAAGAGAHLLQQAKAGNMAGTFEVGEPLPFDAPVTLVYERDSIEVPSEPTPDPV